MGETSKNGKELTSQTDTEILIGEPNKNQARLYSYYDALSRFTRVSPPDKDKLAELVVKAKGPARTMKQFAADIGTTPSTLSRIVNKQNRGANSDKLIAEIAANADPDSGVTFEQLMEAHGMIERRSMVLPGKIFSQESEKIILRELYIRKYFLVDAGIGRRTLKAYPFVADYSLKTDALHDGSGIWGFEPVLISSDHNLNGRIGAMNIDRRLTQIMASYYLGDCLYDRISLVVADCKSFEFMKERMMERLHGRKLKEDISIILLDMEEAHFVDEFIIPNEKNNNPSVFFPVEESPEEANDKELGAEDFYEQQTFLPWLY